MSTETEARDYDVIERDRDGVMFRVVPGFTPPRGYSLVTDAHEPSGRLKPQYLSVERLGADGKRERSDGDKRTPDSEKLADSPLRILHADVTAELRVPTAAEAFEHEAELAPIAPLFALNTNTPGERFKLDGLQRGRMGDDLRTHCSDYGELLEEHPYRNYADLIMGELPPSGEAEAELVDVTTFDSTQRQLAVGKLKTKGNVIWASDIRTDPANRRKDHALYIFDEAVPFTEEDFEKASHMHHPPPQPPPPMRVFEVRDEGGGRGLLASVTYREDLLELNTVNEVGKPLSLSLFEKCKHSLKTDCGQHFDKIDFTRHLERREPHVPGLTGIVKLDETVPEGEIFAVPKGDKVSISFKLNKDGLEKLKRFYGDAIACAGKKAAEEAASYFFRQLVSKPAGDEKERRREERKRTEGLPIETGNSKPSLPAFTRSPGAMSPRARASLVVQDLENRSLLIPYTVWAARSRHRDEVRDIISKHFESAVEFEVERRERARRDEARETLADVGGSPYTEQSLIDLRVYVAEGIIAPAAAAFWQNGRMRTAENVAIEKRFQEIKRQVLAVEPERFRRKERRT